MSRKNFVKGAATLALAGVAVRVIGALYRIPLTNIIGAEGVGIYQMAYPVYALLLTLSTAGIPGAISKMVSERMVRLDEANARRVFRVSLLLLSLVGAVSAAAMALGSSAIAAFISGGSGGMAQPSMLAAAPALFFVAVLTAYRGYFQGLQNMTPTALSQVVEQAVKLFPGFAIAAMLQRKYGVQYGAAGAMWGVTLSEAVALLYLMAAYAVKGRRARLRSGGTPAGRNAPEPFGALASGLINLSLPMMAGAVFLPLAGIADAAIVMNRLADLGYADQASRTLYGILSGMVNVIVNVPSVLSLSLGVSLIPAIAESMERRDLAAVERKSRLGLKMAMLLALPSAAGLAALSRPILDLLYGARMTPEQLDVGGGLLLSSSLSVVFLSVVQATNGTLQGMGRVYVPMVSLAVGAVVKVALNWVLIGIPSVNIHGAPVGTAVCYLIPAVINLAVVTRATGMKPDIAGMLLKPGLAALGMGAGAYTLYVLLPQWAGGRVATAVAVAVAVPLYALFLLALGAVGHEELKLLPGGERLTAFLVRCGLIK